MLFLSPQESAVWSRLADGILNDGGTPGSVTESLADQIRPNLLPVFCYFIGTLLMAEGSEEAGFRWLLEAARLEGDEPFSATQLVGFLERHDRRLAMPYVVFFDPHAFLLFAKNPVMQAAREIHVTECAASLPHFPRPFSMMDLGCGDGALTVALLQKLRECGRIDEIEEIFLIDSSTAMVELAAKTVSEAFPDVRISKENCRIQDCTGRIHRHFDLATSSLAYHHMPYEEKRLHLSRLRHRIDHFILFEMDADNDRPEIYSPDLALAVYQSYGSIINSILSQDAPIELAITCVDQFLMTEVISFFTQPRGERTEYHMLQSQWLGLFAECLGGEFTLLCHSPCYMDRYTSLFCMHFGRDSER
ncbi:class I SAM-dependent methyltransferase [Methanocalculus taiwanensis]|uniref:Class I SAM-dependent methyltransferase n=1 Tax=Methanocalculus taiwanensis TaxID=106207 RepID=A0ABD4TLZ8_9EURY|nr:class I SAM-dependent methyltransferase [Methanocalculus taiwanensis]MCQ1539456.1 class I SAM-dependent methyltransferase [Methanocalculus taiwanensis]